MSELPKTQIAAQLELNCDQVMLGGRPLQDVAAELHTDSKSWTVRRLDFRAPGGTRVSLGGSGAQGNPSGDFKAALNVESSDPDTLMTWLQGRSEITYRSQKPLRLRGDVSVASDRIAIEAMKAEIDGGAVEGRIAVSHQPSRSGSRLAAELKAERLDLDAATALARSLAGAPHAGPRGGQPLLGIGRALFSGRDGAAP